MLFTTIEEINQQIFYFVEAKDLINLVKVDETVVKFIPTMTDGLLKQQEVIINLIIQLLEINEYEVAKLLMSKIYQHIRFIHFAIIIFGKNNLLLSKLFYSLYYNKPISNSANFYDHFYCVKNQEKRLMCYKNMLNAIIETKCLPFIDDILPNMKNECYYNLLADQEFKELVKKCEIMHAVHELQNLIKDSKTQFSDIDLTEIIPASFL